MSFEPITEDVEKSIPSIAPCRLSATSLRKGKDAQTGITRGYPTSTQINLGIRHLLDAGVEVLWRSVNLKVVQRDASVVEVDVRNSPLIGRCPVSQAAVQYLFCARVNNTEIL